MEFRRLKAFRHALLVDSFRALGVVARRLPLKTDRAVGRFLGFLAWHLLPRYRRMAIENVAGSFPDWPDARRQATVRAMFNHLGQTLTELLWLRNLDEDTRIRTTIVENFAPVKALIDSGETVIAFTAHCGNWEWMANCTGAAIPLTVMHRGRSDEELNDFIVQMRSSAGIHTIDRGSPGAGRELIRAMRKPGMLAFLLDQNIRADSVKVPFFGRGALTPIGPAKLAIRSCAWVVTVFAQRSNGGHIIRWNTPFRVDRDDDPVALTARVTAAIEAHIREVPEQWVWFHRRWRERRKWDLARRGE